MYYFAYLISFIFLLNSMILYLQTSNSLSLLGDAAAMSVDVFTVRLC